MYQQIYDPIANNLVLSAVVALTPIIVLFVLLAGIRMAAQWASLITLAHCPRHRGGGLRYAGRAGVELDASRHLLRPLPHRVDRHQRHLSELQIHESSDLAPGCQSKEYPDFGCLQALR